jgi:hypothetical protein
VIELITDKRGFEQAEELVDKLIVTDTWIGARVTGVLGERYDNERFWVFNVRVINDQFYLHVSRDSADELPFVGHHDK